MKIGILGGGQLARMMILDGLRLNLQFRIFDAHPHSSTEGLGEFVQGDLLDEAALSAFSEGLDVISCESENIPGETLRILSKYCPCYPGPEALSIAQDRLHEKEMLQSKGIQTTKFAAIESLDDLYSAGEQFSYPLLLKQRQLGYDGKGQKLIQDKDGAKNAWQELSGAALIAEQFVNFDRELSVIGVFSRTGEQAIYPLVQNEHQAGILRKSTAPAPNTANVEEQAHSIIKSIASAYDYVGVLVVELFQVGDLLMVNEIAPRVHNSGHWTIEGADTSQFENHLRAIAGLPLGSCKARGISTMLNILSSSSSLESYLDDSEVNVHLYNKEAREGRKLGHITKCQSNAN